VANECRAGHRIAGQGSVNWAAFGDAKQVQNLRFAHQANEQELAVNAIQHSRALAAHDFTNATAFMQ